MICQDFWNNTPERGSRLAAEQSAHLLECPQCAAEWEPHRALAEGLNVLAAEWRQTEAPARVEMGLSAAFRVQAKAPKRRTATIAKSWWTPVFTWAGAAAAMLAVAAFLIQGHAPARPEPADVSVPRHTTLAPTEVAAADVETDDDSAVLGEGFVRLPNAPRIGPNEGFNVVQVEMPGSAMIAMGLAVSDDKASKILLADVALGSDGMARAVRLVTEGGSF